MIRGTIRNLSWCGRRWYKDWFWQKERMAEHEEIRREETELYESRQNELRRTEPKEKELPPSPPELWYKRPRTPEANDLAYVRMFIEAVMLDDASFEAGLWQGNMPKDALRAVDRLIELYLARFGVESDSDID